MRFPPANSLSCLSTRWTRSGSDDLVVDSEVRVELPPTDPVDRVRRHAARNRPRGVPKTDTFDFLGHPICCKSRRDGFGSIVSLSPIGSGEVIEVKEPAQWRRIAHPDLGMLGSVVRDTAVLRRACTRAVKAFR